MVFAPTVATEFRLLNVTGLTSLQPLSKLVQTALDAKSAPADELPDKTLAEISLTPSADLLVGDPITGDTVTISARTTYPLSSLEKISVKNAVTIGVEMYFV